MTKAGNYLENALLNHTFGSTSYSPPASFYMGLCSADSGELESGNFTNELANTNGYARQAITWQDDDGDPLPTNSGAVENSATVSFTASGGDWTTATHWFISGSSTHGSGAALWWGSLATSRTVLSGQQLDFDEGTVRVYFETGSKLSDYLKNAWLNHIFGAATFTQPASVYMGLATTDAGQLQANTPGTYELNAATTAPGYSRQLVAWQDGNGNPLPTTTGTVENSAIEQFTASGGDWPAVTYWFTSDSGTRGNTNVLTWGPLDSSLTALDGQRIEFAIGAAVVTVD